MYGHSDLSLLRPRRPSAKIANRPNYVVFAGIRNKKRACDRGSRSRCAEAESTGPLQVCERPETDPAGRFVRSQAPITSGAERVRKGLMR
jgi:hypothetical protein